jgi:hypothetical protein
MLWRLAGAPIKGESPPRRPSDTTWESYPDAVRPTHTVWPSPALCGCCAGRLVSFHDTVPPTPVPPPRHPLERGRWHPRKGYGYLLRPRLGRRRDVRPAERVSSITSDPVQPSPPLCRHPGHCRAIPALWGSRLTGHFHAYRCAAFGLPSAKPSNWRTYGDQTKTPTLPPRSHPWTGTGPARTPARGEIRQDDCQFHDTIRHAAAHIT